MAQILLAKSDCDLRRHLVGSLRRAGHDVAVCDRGDVAYDMLRAEPFDIVLCDVAAVGMDGLSVAAAAAELRPEARVMLIAGFAALPVGAPPARPEPAALRKPVHLRTLPHHLRMHAAA